MKPIETENGKYLCKACNQSHEKQHMAKDFRSCKVCDSERKKHYYQMKREARLAYAKDYYHKKKVELWRDIS